MPFTSQVGVAEVGLASVGDIAGVRAPISYSETVAIAFTLTGSTSLPALQGRLTAQIGLAQVGLAQVAGGANSGGNPNHDYRETVSMVFVVGGTATGHLNHGPSATGGLVLGGSGEGIHGISSGVASGGFVLGGTFEGTEGYGSITAIGGLVLGGLGTGNMGYNASADGPIVLGAGVIGTIGIVSSACVSGDGNDSNPPRNADPGYAY